MEKASKLWEEDDGGMDELQAVLGYKVRSLDLAEVAQKLDRFESDLQHSKTISPRLLPTPFRSLNLAQELAHGA
ncbi:hypothetical protein TIFTF001_014149 [Ficus carica]|uniref:Transcriptional factor DELLA N-terminal domain-containing protein n=1 Tax=Ficus carica TaxID=3494 RepID=A0AA88A388_FICCA|nr:hypothetical protein TIFTF001_014149 [Ficus carica]